MIREYLGPILIAIIVNIVFFFISAILLLVDDGGNSFMELETFPVIVGSVIAIYTIYIVLFIWYFKKTHRLIPLVFVLVLVNPFTAGFLFTLPQILFSYLIGFAFLIWKWFYTL